MNKFNIGRKFYHQIAVNNLMRIELSKDEINKNMNNF